MSMRGFMEKHPAVEDTCDTVWSVLSGGFALLAVGLVWIRELAGQRKSGKDRGGRR